MSPLSFYAVRLLLMGIGLLAGTCAFVAARHGVSISSHSPLLWGVTGVLCIGSCAALILSLWSQARLQTLSARILTAIQKIQRADVERLSPGGTATRTGLGLVMFGAGLFALNVTWVLTHQDPPDDDDQGAYLQTAREIHQRGGLSVLWSDLWSGRFAEANRHPLPLAILSIRPTIEFGRVTACSTAAMLFAGAVCFAWRRFGQLPAGLLSILLATNGSWLYHTPRLVCECLLAGICGLAWFQLVRLSNRPWYRALGAGALLGLAWLTKGTGLLLLYGVVLTELVGLTVRRDLGRARQLLCLLAGFLIVAAPLLARNIQRFGSATYNVNSYLLWVDAYESPNAMAERMTLSEARAAYFSTHSTTDMLEREASGLAWETFIGLRTLGPAPWEDGRVLAGGPLLLIALLGLIAAPPRAAATLVLWTGITWLAMAWYIPIAAGDRFMMPLLIPWLTLAADGLVRWCAVQTWPTTAWRRVLLFVILWGIGSSIAVWSQSRLLAG